MSEKNIIIILVTKKTNNNHKNITQKLLNVILDRLIITFNCS